VRPCASSTDPARPKQFGGLSEFLGNGSILYRRGIDVDREHLGLLLENLPDDFRESGRAQGLGTQEHSIAVLFGDLDQFTMRGVRGGRHFVIESLANRPAYSKTHS